MKLIDKKQDCILPVSSHCAMATTHLRTECSSAVADAVVLPESDGRPLFGPGPREEKPVAVLLTWLRSIDSVEGWPSWVDCSLTNV